MRPLRGKRKVKVWSESPPDRRKSDFLSIAQQTGLHLVQLEAAEAHPHRLRRSRRAGQMYRSFRGWADARMGEPLGSYRRIREAYDQNIRLGMHAGESETLGYAAEALVLAGDWVAAQHQLDQALQIANAHGERVYLPQLFLIEAAIAHARGQSATAEASARRAVAEAKATEAPWLELIALLELCECNGGNAEDRQALAALVKQLPEASDTIAVTRARALLGDTSAA